MKIFSIVAICLGFVVAILGIVGGDFLMMLSSISMSVSFVFLLHYYKNKSQKLFNIYLNFAALYIVLNLLGYFREKGYL